MAASRNAAREVEPGGEVIAFPNAAEEAPQSPAIPITFSDDDLRRLARFLAPELAARLESPWRNAEGAAWHLDARLSRVRKLTANGSLPKHQEGGRVLYHVDDLDAFVRAGGACTE
jgi:hypothetical protein